MLNILADSLLIAAGFRLPTPAERRRAQRREADLGYPSDEDLRIWDVQRRNRLTNGSGR